MNVIAVDVGTTSVRLAIISFCGDGAREANILACHKRDIGHHQRGERFEQSSDEIWQAICDCCHESIKKSNISPDSIESIAFSATCSLVIEQDAAAKQCSGDNGANNVIMWMDHRAIEQAQRITSSNSKVLDQFGGVCSPEFSLAKLVWLQDNEPELFNSAEGFFELPDWLVYKCIGGSPAACPRSLCCVACKWGYDVVENNHCDIINSIKLPKLANKIGNSIKGTGTMAGYLCALSASQLGLKQNHNYELDSKNNKENEKPVKKVVVGTSLIDAHSGMLAMLSVPLAGKLNSTHQVNIESTFCSLAGTSSCHMLLSKERNFTRGIWGPYQDVVLEGYHLLEAGQSLTGKLIEMCIESHEEGKRRLNRGEKMYDIMGDLNEQVKLLVDDNKCFGANLHILPTYHGNRSPLANPRLRGGVYGLSVGGEKSLLEYYVATIEALIYETKLIVEALGTKLETVLVSGGLMKNEFYMQTLAEVLQCRVVRMDLGGVDFMVMGSGLVARHAALFQDSHDLQKTTEPKPLTRESIEDIQYQQLETKIFEPRADRSAYHEKKYLCYKEFVELSQRIDRIMNP